MWRLLLLPTAVVAAVSQPQIEPPQPGIDQLQRLAERLERSALGPMGLVEGHTKDDEGEPDTYPLHKQKVVFPGEEKWSECCTGCLMQDGKLKGLKERKRDMKAVSQGLPPGGGEPPPERESKFVSGLNNVREMSKVDDIKQHLGQKADTVIFFTAGYCPVGPKMNPIFRKAAHKYPDVQFIVVDAHANKAVAQEWDIQNFPITKFFRKNEQQSDLDEFAEEEPSYESFAEWLNSRRGLSASTSDLQDEKEEEDGPKTEKIKTGIKNTVKSVTRWKRSTDAIKDAKTYALDHVDSTIDFAHGQLGVASDYIAEKYDFAKQKWDGAMEYAAKMAGIDTSEEETLAEYGKWKKPMQTAFDGMPKEKIMGNRGLAKQKGVARPVSTRECTDKCRRQQAKLIPSPEKQEWECMLNHKLTVKPFREPGHRTNDMFYLNPIPESNAKTNVWPNVNEVTEKYVTKHPNNIWGQSHPHIMRPLDYRLFDRFYNHGRKP